MNSALVNGDTELKNMYNSVYYEYQLLINQKHPPNKFILTE